MTEGQRIRMYERKKSFVFCMSCLFRAEPSLDVEKMEYSYDLEHAEENVRIEFEGGAVRTVNVNGDSVLGIMKDIIEVLD